MKEIHIKYDKKEQLKVRDIRSYSSTEWLFDNKKKYRDVFHRYDVDYIYCEFSMFNLYFERKEWKYKLNLHCIKINTDGEKEICNLPFENTAAKDSNIISIREGWGHKTKGAFWVKGTYEWRAYIDDVLIATKTFYIEDIKGLSVLNNPFFNFKSVKLFEDDYDRSTEDKERIYFTEFERFETRYIYCEISINNLQKVPWHGEFTFNIYTSTGELKGKISRYRFFSKDTKDFLLEDAGWGSNTKGSWYEGNYVLQVVFFDYIIAEIPFLVGSNFKRGIPNFDLTIVNSFNKSDYELVRIPKELKTPFHQYLIFFKDFVNTTKNRQIIFDVKQVREGLVLEYSTNDELPYNKEDFQRYLREYINFPKVSSPKWNIHLENDASPDLDILLLKLQNKVRSLEADVQIAQKENHLLESQNKYLQNITMRLLPDRDAPKETTNPVETPNPKHLKEKMAKNKVDDVLDELLQIKEQNEVYLLKSQWDNIKKSYLANSTSITLETYNKETNRIKLAILNLIDDLD